MKKNANRILLCCAAIFALSALASCNSSEEETDGEIVGTTDVVPEESPSVDLSEYTLIRPQDGDQLEIEAAKAVYNAAIQTHGVHLSFDTDFVKRGTDPDDANDREILIGLTNRSASAEAYSKIGENEFILAMIDGRFCAVGYTPELTSIATEVLLDTYITEENGFAVSEDFMEIYEAESMYDSYTFSNPILNSGADPWVIRDGDYYYYCYSGGDGVCVSRFESLDQITTNGGKKVYTAPGGTMYSCEYWAPELHKINGKWYIYVAADNGDNYEHRMYVLESVGDDPMGQYVLKGQITDSTNQWAIDGTVLQYKDELYFIWSGWISDADTWQNLYIAHMSDPWTIDGERVRLSRPTYSWERRGGQPYINEGPVALIAPSGETVHIVYSASGSWCDDYCLGLLTFSGEGDILDPENWTKSEDPIFSQTEDIHGPGHCSFTTAADGSTWMVYHANLVAGTGWGGRSVWAQMVEWYGDNIILGTPSKTATGSVVVYRRDMVKRKTTE